LSRAREKSDLFYVIHNYNYEYGIQDLNIDLNSSIVYDCSDSDSKNFETLDGTTWIKTKNSGHSLINFLTFIVDYYHCLPPNVAFLKSNLLERHVSRDYWEKNKLNNFYTPLWEDATFKTSSMDAYRLGPGIFMERNNSWYVWESRHRFFTSYNQMLDFLFVGAQHPEWIQFAPGACYIVEARQIYKYPRSFYQGLVLLLDYDFFPSEAWMLERMLHTIWSGYYEPQEYTKNFEEFAKKIANLNDLSNLKNPSKKFKKKLFRFFKIIARDS